MLRETIPPACLPVMKTLLFSAATFCLTLGLLPSAWANSPQPRSMSAPLEMVEPNGLTPTNPTSTGVEAYRFQGTAADLPILEQSIDPTPRDRTEQLNTAAQQFNQNISTNRSDEPRTNSPFGNIRLPEGLVIRGSSFGGLAVGSEL